MLRLAQRDDGFGITEVVVAATIMLVGMTGLAYVATNTFEDIALARHRTRANSLTDQAIERVRALPYDTVKIGHLTSDLQAHVPEVTNYGGTPPVYKFEVEPGIEERIPHGSTAPLVEPLVPLEQTTVADQVTFRSRTYVTHFNDDPTTGVLRVTTVMTWSSQIGGGGPIESRAQTILYSPTGCLSTASHPFSGPCQAFSVAQAGVAQGQIDTSTPDVFFGSEPITRASLDLADASSSVQIEQLTTIRSQAQRSQLTLTTCSADSASCRQVGGAGQAGTRADNDPGSTDAIEYDTATIPAVNTPSQVFRAAGPDPAASNSIRLGLSADDTGSSSSTTNSTSTNVCEDPLGNPPDNEACGEARSRQENVMDVRLRLQSPELGTTVPARVGPPTGSDRSVRAYTKRYGTDLTGNTCARPGGETANPGNGCIHAEAERRLGNVTLGGLPDNNLTARPTGWTNCVNHSSTPPCDLIHISGFRTTVTAEAGRDAAAPDVSEYSGTVRFWNGSGYTPLNLAPGGESQPLVIPVVQVPAVTVNGVVTTLRVTSNIRTGGTSTETDATCAVAAPSGHTCRRLGRAVANSPVIGTITYEYCQPSCSGTPTWKLTVITEIDIGATTAAATYEDPPSA